MRPPFQPKCTDQRFNFCFKLLGILSGEATLPFPSHYPSQQGSIFKGRFLLFQVYRNFATLFSELLVSTFYKEISKFQQKVQS